MTIASEDAKFQVQLGVKLRAKRMRAGKLQTDGAEAAGCHFSTISRYENGEAPVPPATLMRLAKVYGCRVADFYDGLAIK